MDFGCPWATAPRPQGCLSYTLSPCLPCSLHFPSAFSFIRGRGAHPLPRLGAGGLRPCPPEAVGGSGFGVRLSLQQLRVLPSAWMLLCSILLRGHLPGGDTPALQNAVSPPTGAREPASLLLNSCTVGPPEFPGQRRLPAPHNTWATGHSRDSSPGPLAMCQLLLPSVVVAPAWGAGPQ